MVVCRSRSPELLNRGPGGLSGTCSHSSIFSPTGLQTNWLPVFTELYNSSIAHSVSPEWHVWLSSSGNNCHAVHRSLSSGASVYGILPCPILSAKPTKAISFHNCHWNESLPSGASPWNGMFGRVEGQYTTVPTTSGRPHWSPFVWGCQWPSSQLLSSPQLSHNDRLWAQGISKNHREQGLDYRDGEELSWCPSWSNSLWQWWSCGLVHCPGGNATDPIWRVLASSLVISSWTPLKPQHSNPNPNPLANQLWYIDFLTPPTPLIVLHRLPAFLESLMPLKNWCLIHKSSLKHSISFCGIFSKFKTEFYCISFF